jgi:PAS domain S-box-containing protein
MKKELNRRYGDMFEFVPIGFFSFNPDGQILQINPTGAKLLGADRSDLIDQKFTKFIADDFQAGFQHHCKKVAKPVI